MLTIALFAVPTASRASVRANSSPLLFASKSLTLGTGDLPLAFTEADFNGDGAQDIVVGCWYYPEHGRLVMISGRGDGTFDDFKTIATSNDLGWGPVATADLNQDGRLDLVAMDGSSARIFLGNGDGTFTTGQVVQLPPLGSLTWMIAADVNQDGKPDIIISGSSVYILPGVGDGTLGPVSLVLSGVGASGVAVSDFDRNGIPDLAVARYDADSTTVVFGTGGGQFGGKVDLPSGFGPAGIAAADINDDGNPDIAVANGGWSCGGSVSREDSTVTVYLGDGQGHFSTSANVVVGIVPWSVSLEDVDADGSTDLVVGYSGGGGPCFFSSSGPPHTSPADRAPGARSTVTYPGLSVFRGKKDGTFFEATPAFVATEPFAPAGVADLNGDGRKDLIAVNGYSPQLSVFLANEDGSYGGGQEVSVERTPQHVVISNFDDDKLGDVAVACWASGTVDVILGKPGSSLGSAISSPAGYHPAFLAAGDFDQDGRKDLAVANFGDADTSLSTPQTGAVTILHGNGDGSFLSSTRYPTAGNINFVRVGDLDHDGHLDLVATSYKPPFVSVLLGNGDGTFRVLPSVPISGYRLSGVTLCDLDTDGSLDIALAVLDFENGGVRLLKGNGDGTFAPWTSIPLGGGSPIEAADLNLDERPDLLTALPLVAKLGNGDGTFRGTDDQSIGPGAWGLLPLDLNGDGLIDIATTGPSDRICSSYIGQGTGTFTRRVDYAVGYGPIAVAAGDLNGDGRVDLAVANAVSNTVSILWNRSDPAAPHPAHAFLADGASAVNAATNGSATCFQIQPVNHSYTNAHVNFASVFLESGATGSIRQIPALHENFLIESDQNGDGVTEFPVCFRSADIGRLFAGVKGLQSVNVTLSGALDTGELFRADLTVRVIGATRGVRAYVVGSPSASGAMLFASTSAFGHLTARLYDVRGRLVRTLLDEPFAPAGIYSARIDGSGNSKLSSGVYFYRVDSPEGERSGRIALVR